MTRIITSERARTRERNRARIPSRGKLSGPGAIPLCVESSQKYRIRGERRLNYVSDLSAHPPGSERACVSTTNEAEKFSTWPHFERSYRMNHSGEACKQRVFHSGETRESIGQLCSMGAGTEPWRKPRSRGQRQLSLNFALRVQENRATL